MRGNHRDDINLIMGKAHSRLVEVPILATQNAQTQIKIQDQPDLRYARIVAIESFTRADLGFTQPSGYQLIDGVDQAKITLVLETNDADDTGHWLMDDKTGEPVMNQGKAVWVPSKQSLGNGRFTSTQQNQKYLPLASLHRVQNAGTQRAPVAGPDPFVRELMTFYNMYVSWDKCYLQIQNGGLNNNPAIDLGVGLMVYYSWLDINGKRIERT